MAQAYKPLPHASELWELFAYKPLTGELVRLEARGREETETLKAGTPDALGYRVMTVNGTLYFFHRLVWGWVNGQDPGTHLVDHKDRDPSNNRSWNLRLASRSSNGANRAAYASNKTGFKGVVQYRGKFRAQITKDGRTRRIGTYDTAQEAGAAYAKAAAELHGEFACTE